MGYSKTQRTRPGLDTQLMGAITILLLVDYSYILEQHLEFSVIYQFLWMPPTSNIPASQKPAHNFPRKGGNNDKTPLDASVTDT